MAWPLVYILLTFQERKTRIWRPLLQPHFFDDVSPYLSQKDGGAHGQAGATISEFVNSHVHDSSVEPVGSDVYEGLYEVFEWRRGERTCLERAPVAPVAWPAEI